MIDLENEKAVGVTVIVADQETKGEGGASPLAIGTEKGGGVGQRKEMPGRGVEVVPGRGKGDVAVSQGNAGREAVEVVPVGGREAGPGIPNGGESLEADPERGAVGGETGGVGVALRDGLDTISTGAVPGVRREKKAITVRRER